MKLYLPLLVILITLSCTTTNTIEPAKTPDTIYQLAPLANLIEGLYQSDVSLDELRKHGDFGVGTFKDLNGELILLDGVTYQVLVDGTVQKPEPSITIPWATVKTFTSQKQLKMAGEFLFSEIQAEVSRLFKSKNFMYAVKVHGDFENVKLRSVPEQTQTPAPGLLDVVKQQQTFEHKTLTGTMVGFYLPSYLKGLNATGFHFHFISDDHNVGGHVLDITLKKGVAEVDQAKDLTLSLPSDIRFKKHKFEK